MAKFIRSMVNGFGCCIYCMKYKDIVHFETSHSTFVYPVCVECFVENFNITIERKRRQKCCENYSGGLYCV